jgi:hypothetical protein
VDEDAERFSLLFCDDRTATGTMTILMTTSAVSARTTVACFVQTIVTSISYFQTKQGALFNELCDRMRVIVSGDVMQVLHKSSDGIFFKGMQSFCETALADKIKSAKEKYYIRLQNVAGTILLPILPVI